MKKINIPLTAEQQEEVKKQKIKDLKTELGGGNERA